MTPEQALEKYQKLLYKEAEIHARVASDLEKLALARKKAEEYIASNCKDMNAPDWLFEENPALYWQVSKKSEGLAVKCHMEIDDVRIPQLEAETKGKVENLKTTIEEIEKWSLAQLLAGDMTSFKVSGLGSASIRKSIKYSVADKSLFVRQAVKEGFESELTVTLRPNSKFIASYVESKNELPSGVESFAEQKVVFTKG